MDIEFSLKGNKIKQFSTKINLAKKLLGNNYFDRAKSESKSKKFRRSIFVVKNIKKGDKFTKENIKKIRPGNGLSPIHYNKILRKKSPKNISKGEPLTKKNFKRN